jgi:hypothetical protein
LTTRRENLKVKLVESQLFKSTLELTLKISLTDYFLLFIGKPILSQSGKIIDTYGLNCKMFGNCSQNKVTFWILVTVKEISVQGGWGWYRMHARTVVNQL